MKLQILVPTRIFLDLSGVSSVVAETLDGFFGLLPRRLDCVAALAPGILSYVADGDEAFVAVDQEMLVKCGGRVTISVRRAVAGSDLSELRAAVHVEFRAESQANERLRTAMAALEAGFLQRFRGLSS